MGGNALEVYLDGTACIRGAQYDEVGATGGTGTTLVWTMDISTDRDILIRCK